MGVSRRDFLKISGGTLALGSLSVNLDPSRAYAEELRIKGAKETTTICPYCSVGCGILVHTMDGKVVNAEGDPDHPINEGTLCSKGASLISIVNNPKRITKPQYRSPGASEWKEVECLRRSRSRRDNGFLRLRQTPTGSPGRFVPAHESRWVQG